MNITEIDKIIGRDVSQYVWQTDSRYDTERKRLLADLSEDGIFETVAIHEAGHEYYYAEAGGGTVLPVSRLSFAFGRTRRIPSRNKLRA